MRPVEHTLLITALAVGLVVAVVPAGALPTGSAAAAGETANAATAESDATATVPPAVAPDRLAHGDGPGGPGGPQPLADTAQDAECTVSVDILASGACEDTWNQTDGTVDLDNATWHSTYHDAWTIGTLRLIVTDGNGTEVFRRTCRWFGVQGACVIVNPLEEGTPGEWTMRLEATVDFTLLLQTVAHGCWSMPPGPTPVCGE